MTTYIESSIGLSPKQKQKIARAVKNEERVSIRLKTTNLSGSDKLRLTQQQVSKIARAREKGRGVVIKLSKTQLAQQGGFLGALLGGLAASLIPSLLGGLTGKGMVLPGTTGRTGRGKKKSGKGMILPGTPRNWPLSPIMT